MVDLFRRRMSVERLFSRAKEWLLLGSLKVRGLEQVRIHATLSLTAMLAIALAAVRHRQPKLIWSIKNSQPKLWGISFVRYGRRRADQRWICRYSLQL